MAQYWLLDDDVEGMDEEAADLISMHMSFCCSRDAEAGGELRTSPSESERGARTMLLVVVVAIKAGNLDTSLLLKAYMHPFVHLFARASTTFSLLSVCVHDFLHRQANHSHSMHLTSHHQIADKLENMFVVGGYFVSTRAITFAVHKSISGWVDFNFSGTASLLTEQTTTATPLQSIYISAPKEGIILLFLCRGKRKVLC